MKRHERIESEALDWLARRCGSDWTAAEQAELDSWVEQSSAHKAAYWRAEHGWQQCDRIRALGFDGYNRADVAGWKPDWWSPAAIAASLLAIIAVGGLSLLSVPAGQDQVEVAQAQYQTPIGERKTIELKDGSTVEINTQTVLRTAIGAGSREVWLDGGEAFFDVAHREDVPLVVYAGHKAVTVLGTKFSVRHDERGRVEVNVLEGLVRVDDIDAVGSRGTTIGPGSTAISRDTSTLVTRGSPESVEAALAWRQGMLRFDQKPLSEVVAEFNRYNEVHVVVADPETAQIPIGGSFHVSNRDAFLRLLQEAYGLKIERDDSSVQISRP